MYWVSACVASLATKLHHASRTTRLYDDAGWEWNSWADYRPEREFGTGSLFGVVQSIGGENATDVSRALHPFIGGPYANATTPSSSTRGVRW